MSLKTVPLSSYFPCDISITVNIHMMWMFALCILPTGSLVPVTCFPMTKVSSSKHILPGTKAGVCLDQLILSACQKKSEKWSLYFSKESSHSNSTTDLGGVRQELADQSRLIYLPSTSQQQNAHSSVVRQRVLFFRTNLNKKKKRSFYSEKALTEHFIIKHEGKKKTLHIQIFIVSQCLG